MVRLSWARLGIRILSMQVSLVPLLACLNQQSLIRSRGSALAQVRFSASLDVVRKDLLRFGDRCTAQSMLTVPRLNGHSKPSRTSETSTAKSSNKDRQEQRRINFSSCIGDTLNAILVQVSQRGNSEPTVGQIRLLATNHGRLAFPAHRCA